MNIEEKKKKQFICFVCFLFLVLLNCTTKVAIGLAPLFFGKIIDENSNSIDSAKVEVINIKAAGHESIDDFVGRIYYSDENGDYILNLPGGVEWEEKGLSGKKKYTKYIKSVTIKISKISFRDTVVTLNNTDYENSYVEKDVVLKSTRTLVQSYPRPLVHSSSRTLALLPSAVNSFSIKKDQMYFYK